MIKSAPASASNSPPVCFLFFSLFQSCTKVFAVMLSAIYTPRLNGALTYPSLLQTLYNVNDLLKRDGVMAPSQDSIVNTRKLYEVIGRPLDKIPTIHVGGTNGKVRPLNNKYMKE